MGSVKKVVAEACASGRYIIAITFVDPNTGILQHRVEKYQFPNEDLGSSFTEMSKLAFKSAPGDQVKKVVQATK